jgi:hypothetical protein
MRSKTPLLVTFSLLACGPDPVVSPDEAGDEVATGESTSDAGSTDSTDGTSTDETSSGACPEDCTMHMQTVTPTDCEIDLTETRLGPPCPLQIPYVYVEVDQDAEFVPYVHDCATEDGWTWLVEGEVMGLCGSWCGPRGELFGITYGCPGDSGSQPYMQAIGATGSLGMAGPTKVE